MISKINFKTLKLKTFVIKKKLEKNASIISEILKSEANNENC